MNLIQKEMVDILKREVRPAMGCTEPVAVVLAVAKARTILKTLPESVEVAVSPNFYKNGLSVGIPQTDLVGLDMACALGACGGDAQKGLEILKTISKDEAEYAKAYLKKGSVSLCIANTKEKVYVEVVARGKGKTSRVVIQGNHDNFVLMEIDQKIFFKAEVENKQGNNQNTGFFEMKVSEIIKAIETIDEKEISFLLEGLQMNEKVAEVGLTHSKGMGVGYAIKKQMEDGILDDGLANQAKMLTAAASDARMSGTALPVMSSNGSGNNGLTAILPILAYHKIHGVDRDKLVKALAISHLLNCYIKHFVGRLSALCSCAVSAATGSAVAIAWLDGATMIEMENTIKNMIGNLSGMICDGAKDGCALKLATAAETGINMFYMARYNAVVPEKNGIVAKSVEQTIKNLGEIASEGMDTTDKVILSVMKNMATKH